MSPLLFLPTRRFAAFAVLPLLMFLPLLARRLSAQAVPTPSNAGTIAGVPSHEVRPVLPTDIKGTKDISDDNLLALNLGPALLRQALGCTDLGRTAPDMRMALQLTLKRSVARTRELAAWINATHTPGGPLYATTLTPAEFASRFGLASSDLETLEGWLLARGFELSNVDNGRMAIDLTGTAAQVEGAFHLEMHRFAAAEGAIHYASMGVPQVPRALFPVMVGLAGLDDFTPFRRAQFDGPVVDISGDMSGDARRLTPATPITAGAAVPVVARPQGSALRDASFTASKYQLHPGESARLNIRVSGDATPATGSVAVVDQKDETVAYLEDITLCESYNDFGRSCTVMYKAASAGTGHLTAIYSGDELTRGALLGGVDIATTGTAVTGTVLTPTPVGGYYNGTSAAMIATVTWTAYGDQPTGTISINSSFPGVFGTATMPLPGAYISTGSCIPTVGTCLYTCISTVADKIVSCTLTDTAGFLITGRYPSIPYTATYNGDATYASSSGSTLQQVWVYVPSFTLTVTPSVTSLAAVYGIPTAVTSSEQWTGDGIHAILGPNPDYPNLIVTGLKQMGTMYGGQVISATSNVTSANITGVNYSIPGNVTPGAYNVSYIYEGNSENASLFKSAFAYVPLTVTQQMPVVTMVSPVSAAPARQSPGLLRPFTITGSVAWAGPGIPPTVANIAFNGPVGSNFGEITCTANSPSLCSVVFTPPPAQPPGIYNVNMSFSGDLNYFAAASAQVGNYVIALPPPNLTFSSVSHDFGQVQVGSPAAAYGISVKNLSSSPYVFGLNFTPANGFTSANNCGSSLAAAASCELVFYFTPLTTSPVSALWSLVGESGFVYGPSDGGTLNGSGNASAGVSLSTSTHNFGTVSNGTTSPPYGVVLSNSTSAAVALTYGTLTSPFALSASNCGATLAAGSSCNLQFTFTPASTTTLTQEYTVTAAGHTLTSLGSAVTGVTLLGK